MRGRPGLSSSTGMACRDKGSSVIIETTGGQVFIFKVLLLRSSPFVVGVAMLPTRTCLKKVSRVTAKNSTWDRAPNLFPWSIHDEGVVGTGGVDARRASRIDAIAGEGSAIDGRAAGINALAGGGSAIDGRAAGGDVFAGEGSAVDGRAAGIDALAGGGSAIYE